MVEQVMKAVWAMTTGTCLWKIEDEEEV